MSNLTQEIIALEQNRQAIVDAVNAKGGELAESAPLNVIPQAIEALPSGDDTMLLRAITAIGGDFVVPDGVTAIRSYAFYNSPVSSITFPEGLKLIGLQSLRNLTNITKLDFPDSLTTIGQQGFYFSAKVDTLIFRSMNPPTLGSSSISGNSSNLKIYVPDASVEDYKAATNWSTHASKIHPLSELPQ